MLLLRTGFALSLSASISSSLAAAYSSAQLVIGEPERPANHPPAITVAARQPLHGRFLHLTDIHPDPFYLTGGSEDEACHFPPKHKKKKKKKKHGGLKDKSSAEEARDAGPDYEDPDEEAHAERDGRGDDPLAMADKPRRAGFWGLPISDCDSPLSHVNATFDWIEKTFKGKVDFVVWTGDNARHDIDSRLPRSLPEILNLNSYIVDRVRKTFGKDVPVIASVGNNDVYPHNVMFPGPNKVTSGLLDIWKRIIPEHFLHTFARGGYYSVEAAGGDLLLVSLNTIYFYSRNTVVDGCPPSDEDLSSVSDTIHTDFPAYLSTPYSPASPNANELFRAHVAAERLTTSREMDPGTEQLLWLEQQLVLARARGMQVILTGHVPATEANWYEGCFTRYAQLVLEYQDTIVGQLYGHMNVDMLSFIRDSDTSSSALAELDPAWSSTPVVDQRWASPFSDSIVDAVHSMYSSLPALDKLDERDYLPVHVNPSVIPTYLPGFRVWEYNVSRQAKDEMVQLVRAEQDDDVARREAATSASSMGGVLAQLLSLFRSDHSLKKHKRPPARRPPRHSSPHSPARRNTYLSPLAYTQYFLPLSSFTEPGIANGTTPPAWAVEYTTLSTSELAKRLLVSSALASARRGAKACTLETAECVQPAGGEAAGSEEDPVFPESALPPSVRTLLASDRARAPAGLHALRRALKRARLTPYDGVLSAREGLTVRAWVRAARWVVGKEAPTSGGGGQEAWEAYKYRMGVGSGEL